LPETSGSKVAMLAAPASTAPVGTLPYATGCANPEGNVEDCRIQ
jgi:hypothetical protein